MLGFIAAGAFYDAAQDAGPWACGDILLLPLYQKHFAGTWAERTAITSFWVDSLNLILTKKGEKLKNVPHQIICLLSKRCRLARSALLTRCFNQ
jgi:hypothetical protein